MNHILMLRRRLCAISLLVTAVLLLSTIILAPASDYIPDGRVNPSHSGTYLLSKTVTLFPSSHEKNGTIDSPNRNTRDGAVGYDYYDYQSVVDGLESMNDEHPSIVEITTAQEEYGIPDCAEGYEVHILRITNESTLTPERPEILFLGGIHGDETISVTAAMGLARFLVESYSHDEYVRFLVDSREIYILPSLNPYGLEHGTRTDGNGEDLNRDFSYDQEGQPFTTVGARAVHELMKEHLFISSVNWHSGVEAIGYAWGCSVHNTESDESPDDAAFASQGWGMRTYAGDFRGHYRTGRNNQVIYHARGAFSDYAYAASWDLDHVSPGWPTEGCRSLAYTVEISGEDRPAADRLGTDEEIYVPGGAGDGYIPKNIRMALYMIDTVSPYIHMEETDEDTLYADPGTEIGMEWTVGGCENVDSCQVVLRDKLSTSESIAWSLNDSPVASSWEGMEEGGNPLSLKRFTGRFSAPEVSGSYDVEIRVIPDGHLSQQDNPEPAVIPQSLYVRMRTEDGTVIENGGNRLICQRNVTLISRLLVVNGTVEMSSLPSHAEKGDELVLQWRVNVPGELNHSYLRWGEEEPDAGPDSMVPGTIKEEGTYGAVIELPDKWGTFRFQAVAENESGTVFSSDTLYVKTRPYAEITVSPDMAVRGSPVDIEWTVGGADTVDAAYLRVSRSPDPWTDTLLSLGPFTGAKTVFRTTLEIPDTPGTLYVGAEARVDGSPEIFRSETREIEVLDHAGVHSISVDYTGGFHQLLNIENVTIGTNGDEPGLLNPENVTDVRYTLTGTDNETPGLSGALEFDDTGNAWRSHGINVSSLPEGDHNVRIDFRYGSQNLSSPASEGSLFSVDHITRLYGSDHVLLDDLTLIFEKLMMTSSYAQWLNMSQEPGTGCGLLLHPENSSLPLIVLDNVPLEPAGIGAGDNADATSNEDIINLSRRYRCEIDLGGVRPGLYGFSFRVHTIFDSHLIEGELTPLEITGPPSPEISVNDVLYSGGMEQVLSLTGIEGRSPDGTKWDSFNRYSEYLENVNVSVLLEMGSTRVCSSFTQTLTNSNRTMDRVDLELSHFPSGEIRLSLSMRYIYEFPFGGNWISYANYLHNSSITIDHIYWFEGDADVLMEETVVRGEMERTLAIANVSIGSTSEYPQADALEVRAALTGRDGVISTEELTFNSTSSSWELAPLDISDLTGGRWHINLTGSTGRFNFYGTEEYLEGMRFIVPEDVDDRTWSEGPWPWIILLTVILSALAALLRWRCRRRAAERGMERESDEER